MYFLELFIIGAKCQKGLFHPNTIAVKVDLQSFSNNKYVYRYIIEVGLDSKFDKLITKLSLKYLFRNFPKIKPL